MQINHNALRAAQNKAIIAVFLGDGKMWKEARIAADKAINRPWYRGGKRQ